MKKNKTKLASEKERDFLLAYEDELKAFGAEAPYMPRRELILRALYSDRARFYVSYEEASRQVRSILNHRPTRGRNECKTAMYQELARLVAEYMERHPQATCREALFTILAEGRASRFFFGEQTARLILSRYQREYSPTHTVA